MICSLSSTRGSHGAARSQGLSQNCPGPSVLRGGGDGDSMWAASLPGCSKQLRLRPAGCTCRRREGRGVRGVGVGKDALLLASGCRAAAARCTPWDMQAAALWLLSGPAERITLQSVNSQPCCMTWLLCSDLSQRFSTVQSAK